MFKNIYCTFSTQIPCNSQFDWSKAEVSPSVHLKKTEWHSKVSLEKTVQSFFLAVNATNAQIL